MFSVLFNWCCHLGLLKYYFGRLMVGVTKIYTMYLLEEI